METQNAEKWNINCYIRDVAEEVAKYTFNHGKYPAIKFLEGYDVDEDTQIETNSNGVLNVYIPQNFNQQDFQQFQQALQERIAEGSNLKYGGQAPCTVRVQQCSKEEAEKVQQNIHKWNNEYEKAYYRLIQNSDNDFYVMTCIAPTPQIKQQIQRQFEQSNGYYNGYYYQTDAGEANSSESLSKEDIYLTALKLFCITGNNMFFQNLPAPDPDDDEDQQQLYAACKWLQVHPNSITIMRNNFVLPNITDEQFDLDERLKKYTENLKKLNLIQQGIQISPAISQVPFVPANNVQLIQTPVPIYQGPVPVQYVETSETPVTTTDQNYQQINTNNGQLIFGNEPNNEYDNTNNQYFITDNNAAYPGNEYATTNNIINTNVPNNLLCDNYNNMNNANITPVVAPITTTVNNNINLQQEEQFEDFGTIHIEQISGTEAANSRFKVTCNYKNCQTHCFEFNDVQLKDVIYHWTTNLGVPNGDKNSWKFENPATRTEIGALLWNLRGNTIQVKQKKKLVEIDNNYNNINNNMVTENNLNQQNINNAQIKTTQEYTY